MLGELFADLKTNKASYLNARRGQEFEDRIEAKIRALGYLRTYKDQVDRATWKTIKTFLANKLETNFLDTPPELRGKYLREPYGSQAFPDFLIFTDGKAVPIEIKFTTASAIKPFWNSNVPRVNSFYIFGSYGRGDLTFFSGDKIISNEYREKLIHFFDDIQHEQIDMNKLLKNIDDTKRGFTVYIRKAFDQKQLNSDTHLNYFTRSDRKRIESDAIERSNKL